MTPDPPSPTETSEPTGPIEPPAPPDPIGHGDGAPLVTIVLPAKDEEAALDPILRSLPTDTLATMGLAVETLVLDGQSEDATRDIAYEHGGTTVVFDREHGKGRALTNGREHVDGDYVVMLDADGTYALDAIPRLLAPLLADTADVVAGRRRIRPGAMSPTHRIGNRLLSLLAQALYLRPCPDLCTGMWGFQADALAALPLRSRGFELEAEMFALSSRLGLRLEHVPVDYLPRMGASKLDTTDGLRIAWWLVRSRFAPLGTGEPGGHPQRFREDRPQGG